ncbi:MAG: hypothetical protein QG602_542 [Verrucomicrobiota bacterium]|nr:hypothetical protein [Verrucomicrobiota bacterium]
MTGPAQQSPRRAENHTGTPGIRTVIARIPRLRKTKQSSWIATAGFAGLAMTKVGRPGTQTAAGACGLAPRTESAIVVGRASASPRSLLKRMETVLDTPRSCIVTP